MISKKNQVKLKIKQNKLIQRLRPKEIKIRSKEETKGTVELKVKVKVKSRDRDKVRDNSKDLLRDSQQPLIKQNICT